MDYPQIRRVTLEALKEKPATDWSNFHYLCARIAYENGFLNLPGGLKRTEPNYPNLLRQALSKEAGERLREVFWALLIEGVIILGKDDDNPSWPWFRVTEYGQKVLEAGEVIPHDPDGYLERVHNECAPFDPIAEFYLQEALQCFLRGTYTASAVMLGVAAEQLFLNLLEALIDSLQPSASEKLRQATSNRRVGRQWEEFRKRLDSQKDDLPEDLQDDLDTLLNGIFTLIRATRNESGHPTGKKVDREVMFAHLQLFRPYAKRVVALTAYFEGKEIDAGSTRAFAEKVQEGM